MLGHFGKAQKIGDESKDIFFEQNKIVNTLPLSKLNVSINDPNNPQNKNCL